MTGTWNNRLVPVTLTVLLFTAPSCGRPGSDGGGEAGRSNAGAIETQPATPDPCGWLSAEEVAQLLGPLVAPPVRADDAESPEPDGQGKACLYRVADEAVGQLAVQVDPKDATVFESGSAMAMDALARDLGPGSAGAMEDRSGDGWDYVGGLPGVYVGRVGHIAVQVGYESMTLPESTIAGLAVRVRDRVPDLPFAAPGANPKATGSGTDPCALLTRTEAESVLGSLPTAPYRSRESTPFADGRGGSCSYYSGRHRVLVLTPTWSDGRAMFGMVAGFNQRVTSTLGGGESADTLDGPWDQAGSGISGELYFLKGDRMLEILYRTSAIDAASAVRLAAIAMQRL